MDKLKQIEAFVAAIEHGSFARASIQLAVTPVMLGRRIDALERRLGVRLLHRTTRHLGLTEEGSVFLEHCRQLLSGLDQAEQIVSEGKDKVIGHLVVSAPAAFGRKHVAPYAPEFIRTNPDVQVTFNLTDRIVDLVREGYDVGIRIGGTIDPNCVAVKLAPNRRVVCGTPEYFARFGIPKTLYDLERHNCLAYNLQGGLQREWHFQVEGKRTAIRVSGSLHCNDGELLHQWSCNHIGLAWRSTWEIQAELASGRLITVLDEFAHDNYDIMAVYPHQRHVPAKVRSFITLLKAKYSETDYWRMAASM